MKVSTRGRYGLRALVDLAIHSEKEPISLASISARQGMSLNYLEQTFRLLREANIVKGTKGAQGGYQLVAKPEDVCVKHILGILEGELTCVTCEHVEEQSLLQRAIREALWEKIDKKIFEMLQSMKLSDLIKVYKKKKDENNLMFYI